MPSGAVSAGSNPAIPPLVLGNLGGVRFWERNGSGQVAPGDADYLDHARRLLHAVADRARWQAALNEARRRAAMREGFGSFGNREDSSQSLRSARWSARVLPDHLRDTSTRRPA